jgi:GntR family transcriptional repressor for pyruvate dehydrogenase complex
MTFESIKLGKVSDAVVNQIEQLILDGVLKPGDKLPSERDLAQELEVSRPSLREALLKLEAKGLLQARRGGGTFIADIIAPTLTDPLVHLLKDHPGTKYDILELRHALEEVAAYFAAARCTESDREILRRRFEAVEAMRRENDSLRNAETDAEFHLAIADASHNVALMHVMRGLFNLLRSSIRGFLEKIQEEYGDHQIVDQQHERIFNAVMEKDPAAARRAAHVHLAFIEKTLRKLDAEETREESSQRRLRNFTE